MPAKRGQGQWALGYREPLNANEQTKKDSDPLTVRKLPGLTKYSNITLKRGITDDTFLWDWRKKAIDGKTERKNGWTLGEAAGDAVADQLAPQRAVAQQRHHPFVQPPGPAACSLPASV